ncbi:hypothetical protein, partial [Belnapia arida]|uniref:hypothetical protein n=1 Tax=Belnapia arida TaxID=2804533 RepID=UPI001F45A19F
ADHTGRDAQANAELTFTADHPMGADHSRDITARRPDSAMVTHPRLDRHSGRRIVGTRSPAWVRISAGASTHLFFGFDTASRM